MNAPPDAIGLPLSGVRVVEASAGTGKTFTIATLYLRLILERGCMPERIVVATFARDAAAELSARLRDRLRRAKELLSAPEPATPCTDDDGETEAARRAIAAARYAGVGFDEQRQRARDAELAMDTAVIGTLHAFCARLLGEFGFETGVVAETAELLEDLRGLQEEIVADFWRERSGDAGDAALLAAIWRTPQALAEQACDARWRGRAACVVEPDLNALTAERARLREAIAAWSDSVLNDSDAEIGRCIVHPQGRKPRLGALRNLREWARDASVIVDSDAFAFDAVDKFSESALKKIKLHAHPRGEVFDLARVLHANLSALRTAREAQAQLPAARLLLAARGWLDRELPIRLRALGKYGYDQIIEALDTALADPARGAPATARIRERYPCALIDEFQDTDRAQWSILRRLFRHEGGTLILVGDPKQAIYGFRGGDVHTYLAARADADGEALPLSQSQRAGERVCEAIDVLFSRPRAFVESGIGHPDLQAAPRVRDIALLVDGVEQPGLTLWRVPCGSKSGGEAKALAKGVARAAIQSACVARIVALLKGARDGKVALRAGDGKIRPLQAGDIALLVNSNFQAHAMQRALGRAGVAASCRLRASVYAGEETHDVLRLLEALRDPADAARARAAHAGLLIGADASAIAATLHDAAGLDALIRRVSEWSARAARHGVLALLHRLIAQAAPRLLALADGPRRVANYLQLAELAQQLSLRCFGLDDLVEQFARRMREAGGDSDAEADAARLRLESDAQAVQIATVHAAKGLEYGVVLLPYAGFGRHGDKPNAKPALTWYHDGDCARVAIGAGVEADIARHAADETLAEEVRKFYVGVTRARASCIVPWGWISQGESTAVHWLLHCAGREHGPAFDEAGCTAALHELAMHAPRAIAVEALPAAPSVRLAAEQVDDAPLRAAEISRAIERDWRTWSFSRLVRGEARTATADPSPGAGDDGRSADDQAPARPALAGPRFGSAVHAALERTDFAAWRDAEGIPDSQRTLLERSLRAQGLPEPGSVSLERAIDEVGACMRTALNATLPCGARLCDLAPDRRRAEMEFHLRLAPMHTAAFFALLHAHGYQRGRNGFGADRLHGLLTGVIDLVFEHDDRFHLIDYKTNRLESGYDAASLRAAIDAHDYDLQWLLYTLALHRWLRQALPDYDYDTHVGETYYLFVRGLHDGRGVHRDHPPRALIEAMDALFDARAEIAA